MPLPLFVGCAVQYFTNHAQHLLSKVPIVLEPLTTSPLLATITGSTYYGQFLEQISVVDATLFACRFTKLYRSYYPLPIIVIVKPVTKKDIVMKMLDSFIANEFISGTCIAIILLLTTLYIAIFIQNLKKRSVTTACNKSKTTAAGSFLPAMSLDDIRFKKVTRDARLHAFAGSLINHCFVAWFISLYWNFPDFIFNVYSEISTYLSTTPVQNIIKHALLMIFVFNFRSVARIVRSVSQRYIRGESSMKTIPTDLLQLFTYSGPTLRQMPQYALELLSSFYHGFIDSLIPIYLIYLIRENLNRPITLPLVKPPTNFNVNLPLPTNSTSDVAINQPPPALEDLPELAELFEIVEEEIIAPLSTSTILEQPNLSHFLVASGSGLTSNDSLPSPKELNQEILIVEEIITSNSPLPTSNTPELIALPYIPFASVSSLTFSGFVLLPKELGQEEIIMTAFLAPVLEEIQPFITYETYLPGTWVSEPFPLVSQGILLLQKRETLTGITETINAHQTKRAEFIARDADLVQRT